MEKIKNFLSKIGLFDFIRKIVIKPYYNYKSYVFRKHSLEAFNRCLNAFEKTNKNYWLEFGTLLGAIREKNFIKHDLDIDFAMLYSEKNEALSRELEKNGFKKEKEIYLESSKKVVYEAYNFNNKFSVDIYYFIKNEGELFFYNFFRDKNLSYSETIKKNGGLNVELIKFPLVELQRYSFKNRLVNIPKKYKEHLEITYGKDYMIPKKSWDNFEVSYNRIEQKLEKGIVKLLK